MASEVDICNLALAHLGDSATVASIDPPEGSAQAEHCQRFYPIARDSLLEMHNWKFATRRVRLALLDTDSWNWAYAYAEPADAMKIVSILPPGATPIEPTADYETMSNSDGDALILTDLEEATALYAAEITDTTKFSPLFITTLSWHLASMLAGPVIKGDVGAAEAKRCQQMMAQYLAQARVSDANQRKVEVDHMPNWIGSR